MPGGGHALGVATPGPIVAGCGLVSLLETMLLRPSQLSGGCDRVIPCQVVGKWPGALPSHRNPPALQSSVRGLLGSSHDAQLPCMPLASWPFHKSGPFRRSRASRPLRPSKPSRPSRPPLLPSWPSRLSRPSWPSWLSRLPPPPTSWLLPPRLSRLPRLAALLWWSPRAGLLRWSPRAGLLRDSPRAGLLRGSPRAGLRRCSPSAAPPWRSQTEVFPRLRQSTQTIRCEWLLSTSMS